MKIRLAGIEKESIVDGPGIRYAIFTQGCLHNCFMCHNPATHDVSMGSLREVWEILEDIKSLPFTSGITLSGGEPFLQIDACYELVSKLDIPLHIMAYTGYAFEELLEMAKKNSNLMGLLEKIDILIDGRFDYSKRDLNLSFRGSSNQRVIDVKKSLLEHYIILKEI